MSQSSLPPDAGSAPACLEKHARPVPRGRHGPYPAYPAVQGDLRPAAGPKPRRQPGASSHSGERPGRHFSALPAQNASMARTYGNMWPRFVSWENLLASYHLCRRRKRASQDAVQFEFHWESELLKLQRELIDGCYAQGPYRNFYIHEPKRREISAAPFRDRIVHHALVRVLEPIFERRFIFDSYACRRNKGTHRAVDRGPTILAPPPILSEDRHCAILSQR